MRYFTISSASFFPLALLGWYMDKKPFTVPYPVGPLVLPLVWDT